jgi:molybdopterin converting factor small subunit
VEVKVKLVSAFKKYLPPDNQGGEISCALNDPATIFDLIKALKLPSDMPFFILRNGNHAQLHTALQDNDHVTILPPATGG